MKGLIKFSKLLAFMALGFSSLDVAFTNEIFEAPSSLCYISYNQSPSLEIRCSGVLLSNNFIVTAAHCFRSSPEQVSSISVQCGLLSQAIGGENFAFKEIFTAQQVRLASDASEGPGLDFAFVKLNHPATRVKPMTLPSNLASFRSDLMTPSQTSNGDYEFKQSIECRSSGFGYDPEKKKSYFLTSDQSPSNGLKGFQSTSDQRATSLMITSWGEDISKLRHGDSGGALYCRSESGANWQLVGVISGGVVSSNGKATGTSLFAATASNEFLHYYSTLVNQWK